jgi:hypothetical protein
MSQPFTKASESAYSGGRFRLEAGGATKTGIVTPGASAFRRIVKHRRRFRRDRGIAEMDCAKLAAYRESAAGAPGG